MNRQTKAILKENNKLEKNLSEETDKILTDIVVYLRHSDINEYNQELARRDITNMLIEGEARGESAAEVIGADYKAFCDEVIAEMPKRTIKEQIKDSAQIALECIGIILGIWTAIGMLGALAAGKTMVLTVTWGDVITAVLISVLAITTVNLICRDAFEKVEKGWVPALLFGAAAALCVLPGFLVKAVLLQAKALVLLAVSILLLGICKLLDIN